MLWDAQQDKDLLDHYSKLCHIRQEHRSLSRGKHEGLVVDGEIYVFRRSLEDGTDKVVVAINRAQQDGEVTVDLAGSSKLVTLAGAADVPVDGGKAVLKIPARGFGIYREQ